MVSVNNPIFRFKTVLISAQAQPRRALLRRWALIHSPNCKRAASSESLSATRRPQPTLHKGLLSCGGVGVGGPRRELCKSWPEWI